MREEPTESLRRHTLWILVSVLVLVCPCASGQEEPEETPDYRYGSVRLGVFWVGQIDHSVVARSEDFPVGIFIDLSEDFGLGNSVTVPRGMFTYRFSRRHQVNASFYKINLSHQIVLDRTIEIGENEYPIGAQVDTFADVTFYKASYTWFFYDQDKVVIGASAGLNVIDFNVGLKGMLDVGGAGGDEFVESGGTTAPVPVIGLRIGYRATPKLSLVAAVDFLSLEIGEWGGSFRESYALLDWRFSKHFSIGGGINSLNLDVSFDDDVLASYRQNYRGAIAFFGVHF